MAEASNPRERVSKLLALADPRRNPDIGEAVAAFRKAYALMRPMGIGFEVLATERVVTTERIVERKVSAPCVWCNRFERRIGDILGELELLELTNWERSFVLSVRDQLRRRHRLSDKQIEVLKRIAEDYKC